MRRINVPVQVQGFVTLSYVCPHCHRYPLEDCIWWVSLGGCRWGTVTVPRAGRSSVTGGVRRAVANTTCKIRKESW